MIIDSLIKPFNLYQKCLPVIVMLCIAVLSTSAHGSGIIEKKGDCIMIKHKGMILPVSLNCPQFTVNGVKAGVGAKQSHSQGDILRGEPMQISFEPIPLDGSAYLDVKLHLQWSPKESVLRKWASFCLNGTDSPHVVENIVLEDIIADGEKIALIKKQPVIQSPQSYPVFFKGFFAGIEFPMAATKIEGNHAIIAHNPGLRIQPGTWYQTRKAVFGVSDIGKEWDAFIQYIESHRHEPKEFHANYNHWWSTPVRASEPDIVGLMKAFKDNLYDPYNVSFDTFCIDVGWQNPQSIWEMDPKNFPGGFDKIRKLAAEMKTDLAIWISPSSVYADATDLGWAGKNGYETSSIPWGEGTMSFACLGGKKYQAKFRDRIVDMINRYGIKSIKFDGYMPTCPEAGHGHEPGPLSSESIAEGMIDVFESARKADPGIRLRPTCFGWNPSPWWLFYTNTVIGSYGDDATQGRIPSPVYKESYTTSRDYFNLQGAYYSPISAAAEEVLGICHQSKEPFMNDAVMTVMRGNIYLPLYLNPKFMDDYRWRQLADLLKWGRKNQSILKHTIPLLPASWQNGDVPKFSQTDPMPREPYGYAHINRNTGLIALRNPWLMSQTYSLKLDNSMGFSAKASELSALSLYPESRLYGSDLKYGDTLAIQLAPYETVVLSVKAGQQTDSIPAAAGKTVETIKAKVYDAQLSRVELDKTLSKHGPSWTSLLGDVQSAIQLKLEANVNITAPDATLLVLIEGDKSSTIPAGRLSIDGNETPMQVNQSSTGWASTGLVTPEYWTFMQVKLPTGSSSISLDLLTGADCRNISAWVWTTKPGGKISGIQDSLPEPETISLHSVPLLSPTDTATLPASGVKIDPPVERINGVYLDTLEPIEITQGWGTLQRNRSVWEKPLTIGGKGYIRGLGTSSQTRIVYALDGKYSRFTSWVGADGATSPTITFEILVDGIKKWESGLMKRDDSAKLVDLDITGAKKLEIIVGDGGDGITSDHADLADAKLLY